ncbi:unnamed protein product [Rhizophagus irregularis]|nr:unnamed protein product [Rhizophagus irregularis]
MIDTKDIANLKKDNHKQYFTQLSESIVSIIEDERCLAKYGPTLLSNLVKSADPKFTHPFNERIHSDGDYSHFCTLCDEVEIRKIDQSIKNIIKSIKLIIELIKLIFATILYLAILILLLPFTPFIIILMIICLIMGLGEMIPFLSIFLLAIPYYIVTSKPFNMEKQRKQQIVLIIPYIDYSRYPLEYSFWKEIFYPQSSVFVNTYSLNEQNPNDSNNPWTLYNTYNQVDENGNILNETLIQVPSENTNLFYSYPTSLLATYLFLTGNQNSLSPWAPKPTTENTLLFILMAVFSFLIVIYLMNLFIGLLNMAIEKDNDRALYLVQKAEVLAEIELFYLLPHQRRWRSWFPEVIYCRVDVEKTRIYIKEAIKKGKWNMDDWPEMKHKILKRLSVDDAIIDLAV